jgi:hypothetical protein
MLRPSLQGWFGRRSGYGVPIRRTAAKIFQWSRRLLGGRGAEGLLLVEQGEEFAPVFLHTGVFPAEQVENFE